MLKKEPEQSHQSSSINENDVYVGSPKANTKTTTSILKAPPIPSLDKNNSMGLQKIKSEREHNVSFIDDSHYSVLSKEISPTHEL